MQDLLQTFQDKSSSRRPHGQGPSRKERVIQAQTEHQTVQNRAKGTQQEIQAVSEGAAPRVVRARQKGLPKRTD